MMLQLQLFKFTVVKKKGKYMYLADAWSRATLTKRCPPGPQEVFMCVTDGFQEAFRIELETLELDTLEMYPSTLEEIKTATKADSTLSILCNFVANRWPSDKSHIPTALRHYYPLRDELAVHHGVLYQSQKVVIPQQLQPSMLRKLHQSHKGGESMVR